MGHFGKRPIRLAFFALVLPALLLNYFGQGALLLRDPDAVENPFYLLAPRWALYPLLLIATLAAIVASQALISGVFSLAQQAMQLGFIPRMTIVHTSRARARPDLRAADQHGARGRHAAHRRRLQVVERARRGVRHRRHGDDGDHDAAVRRRGARRGGAGRCGASSRWRRSSSCSTSPSSARTRSRSCRAAGCRSLIALGVLTLMTTWKRGRERAVRDHEEPAACRSSCCSARSSAVRRRASRARRCS